MREPSSLELDLFSDTDMPVLAPSVDEVPTPIAPAVKAAPVGVVPTIAERPESAFLSAIIAAGLTPPEFIEPDGTMHRFSSNGKRGDKSGWYILHLDGVPAGVFGCWRDGLSQTWCSKPDNALTEAEKQAMRQRVQAAQAARDAAQVQARQQAQATAQARWDAASPATAGHSYLVAKGVQAHGLRLEGDKLVIPLCDVDGVQHSLQTIAPNGEKRFLTDGKKKGCFYGLGQPGPVLVICEGFATGASIHEATGLPVAVAFDAYNLLPVAQALRTKSPDTRLILAADNDTTTEGNPGLTKATEAAQAVAGVLALAVSSTAPEKKMDFNDLHQAEGLEAVARLIESAAMTQAPTMADTGGDGDTLGWSDPTPLPNDIPPVAPFDLELLPEALRGWVADIAERMQCPPDFTAVGAITALSGLIGARAVVKPKQYDDWAVVPVLWGAIVGRPGVMKSPALSEVLKPIKRLEAEELDFHHAIMGEWELDTKLADLQNKANEKQAEKLATKDPAKARDLLRPTEATPAPTLKRYMVNDTSMEKLAMMLTENPWGLLVYRDEIHGLLASMDKEGQEGARAFYLTGYDGNQGYSVHRVTRQDHYVPRVCLAMLGGIQPGKLQAYVRGATSGGEADDGLMQRFSMVIWPDICPDYQMIDRWPDTAAKQLAWDVFERLGKLQPLDENTPQEWHFTPEAQAIYREWVEPFEREIRGDTLHPALVSHLSKYRKLVPALALIFALIDTPDSGHLIDTPELLRALAWQEYLRTHAQRVYAAAVVPETSGAKTLLARLQAGKLIDRDGVVLTSFTAREVSQKHWAGLDTPEAVRKGANLLADYGWLDRETVLSGDVLGRGRPKTCYHLHPCLLSKGAS